MITSAKNNWAKAKDKHLAYLNKKIDTYLKTPKNTPRYNFIKKNKNNIISENITEITNSIADLKNTTAALNNIENQKFKKELQKLFNYSSFIQKSGTWNAYELCKLSEARVCPYCNQAFAFTITTKKKSIRPTLDHFYDKDSYPHLALSLMNLIPSCSTCNSTLKGRSNFIDTPHLHPLYDDENIDFFCDTNTISITEIRSNFENIKSALKFKARAAKYCKKTENSISTFIINERYELFSNEAIDFISSKILLDEILQRKEEINLPSLSASNLEHKVLRFDKDNYKNQPLGKMFLDLYKQFDS